MRILFAAPENAWGGFLEMMRKAAPEYYFEATGGFWVDSMKGFDVLIPTMCRITRDTLADADRLKLIQQCGAGLEMVDLAAARERGVRVANVPTDVSGNADSVAEVGIYMMIGLARNFREMAKSLADRKMGQPQGMALRGRTVGLVGLGGIGKALIKRLEPFDVRLIGIKKSGLREARETLGLEWVGGPEDLDSLLAESDFVMLCLPVTSESSLMIDEEALSRLKPGAFLINLSRGGLVDHEALTAALESGRVAGAGLDVFWEEPPDPNHPIFGCNVLATPHIAGSTDVSMRGIVKGVAENIRRIERNREPLNAVV